MAYSGKRLVAPRLAAVALATTTTMVVVVLLAVAPPPCAAQSTAQDFVDLHNTARAAVGVTAAVSWNDTLATYAENYAETRQADCQLKASSGPYGENLFLGPAGGDWTAADVVGAWVDEKKYYDHDTNTCAEGKDCTSYTQVVWSRTTAIGCAGVTCSNRGGVFVICSYYPPGNLVGESPY